MPASKSIILLLTMLFCLHSAHAAGIPAMIIPTAPATVMPAAATSSASSPAGLVTSIYPVYLIARAVTAGIEEPYLLGSRQRSGHHLQLRPQDRLQLQRATLVVWVGPQLEGSLAGTLQQHPRQLKLGNLPLPQRLPLRDQTGQPVAGTLDPHLWLAPANSLAMAQAIVRVRSQQYPAAAARYQANLQQLTRQLQPLLTASGRRPAPYVAWHDAYQYLEKPLQLQRIATLTADPEQPVRPGQWLSVARSKARYGKLPVCVISDQSIPPQAIQRLGPVRHLILDENLSQADSLVAGLTQLAVQTSRCIRP